MSTVLETPVEIEGKPATQNLEAVNEENVLIDDAIRKIEWHQQGIKHDTLNTIIRFFGIGHELNDLHSVIEHGNWEKRVEQEVDLDKTTILRLRTLASSPLRVLIMTNGQDLKDKLSLDIQKIVTMAKLSDDQIREFFEKFNPSKMSRTQLRAVVEEIRGKSKSKDVKPKKKRAKPSTNPVAKAMQSSALPIDQLFAVCGEPIEDLTTSVSKQLEEGQVDQDSIVKAEAVVDHALKCLNKLKKSINEKLAA